MSSLTTNRLLLRMITISDVDDVYDYSCAPNVGPNAGWKPHENPEETLKVMESIFMYRETVWGIVLRSNQKLIGSVGLIDDPKREYPGAKMIGYALGEAYWNEGYMTEAVRAVIDYGFHTLRLPLISAYCYSFNERSKHVLRKCGFSYEGTLKMAEKRYDGLICDNECYCLINNENGNTD